MLIEDFTTQEFVREVVTLNPTAQDVAFMVSELQRKSGECIENAVWAKSRGLAEYSVRMNSRAVLYTKAASALSVLLQKPECFVTPETLTRHAA